MLLGNKGLYRGQRWTWLWVGVLLLPLTWWSAYNRAWTSDAYLYDQFLSWQSKAASSRLLIVAIDERSLSELGVWPWHRDVHARLVERLADANVRAVLFDVLFAEPSQDAQADQKLARAMVRQGHVFLPMIRLPVVAEDVLPNVLLPTEPLLSAARGVGHIHVEPDPDGMVRSIFLREGHGEQRWPQLIWRVYEDVLAQASRRPVVMPGRVHPGNAENWSRDHQIRIPYRGRPGHYPTVSYSSVLNGDVSEAFLRDRIILIGATAAGLGDRHAISLAGEQGNMAGVEIKAHLLNGLMDDRIVVDVEPMVAAWLSVLPPILLMLALWWLKFRYLPWLATMMVLLVMGAAWGALFLGWWWPPSTSMAAVIMAYVLLSWRSQAAALKWFQGEIALLEQEPKILPEPWHERGPRWGSALQQQFFTLHRAVEKLRDTRGFIIDALDSFSVALCVVTLEGRILLANRQAREMLASYGLGQDSEIGSLLSAISTRTGASLQECPLGKGLGELHGMLLQDANKHYFRLEVAPLHSASSALSTGWLVGFVDMTSEKRAEDQHAHMLRFLSHDLKAPQSSILALIDLQEAPDGGLPESEFRKRVAQQVHTALSLTEDFMQLTKVEFGSLTLDVVILADIVLDALDQAWPLAQARKIELTSKLEDDGCEIAGNRGYLVRAIFNVLENAIKYSPPGSQVTVSVWEEEGFVLCEVRDQGVGIEEVDQPYIFESYRRSNSAHMADGYGLGLALVKAVMDKHHAKITCDSAPGKGSRFCLVFAVWNEAG
ncbi:unnamed protein product [Ectocarpus sp. 12 AP-2014]